MNITTDASIFEITPKKVVYPKNRNNLIDIVPISFYKIFGFPTGLGALIVLAQGSAVAPFIYTLF